MRGQRSLALAVLLTLALTGCAGPVAEVTGPPSQIPLPNFVGLEIPTAEIMVTNLDLVAGADSDAGKVASQDPEPGTLVAPGSTVHLKSGSSETSTPAASPMP